jgi:hypothetical protein
VATSLALLLVLMPLGCGRERASQAPPLATSAPAAPMQEVAPPPGVQQLATALGEHSPQVSILAPADGSTVPNEPWNLRLQLRDWPLADAGDLGLGAHVVVQLDDEPPQRIAQASQAAGSPSTNAGAQTAELNLTMPPLRPGSHRLTVFAARPWGEVVKSPGASSQILLQRVAPNPLRVPAPGSPQLIAVSPGPEPRPEPVLVDWLLLDAPLQGLREGDASWRLRVSVNGDSFLVDQNSPLWLKGWRSGSNSLQLELVDGRGEPLNPPFNSLVTDVVIQANAPRPAWLNRLEPADLARLLGQAPPTTEPIPEPSAAPAAEPPLPPEPAPEPEQSRAPSQDTEAPPEPEPAASAAPDPATPSDPATASMPEPPVAPRPLPGAVAAPEPTGMEDLQGGTTPGIQPDPDPEAALEPVAVPLTQAEPTATAASSTIQPAPTNPERIAPSTSLRGSAREQVRDDGSLIQPRSQGPLAGLRERLGS